MSKAPSRSAAQISRGPIQPGRSPKLRSPRQITAKKGKSDVLSTILQSRAHCPGGVSTDSTERDQDTVEPQLDQSTPERRIDPEASIVLIGIRGSGKRSLGLIAAAALGWRFITEDLYFKKVTSETRATYVEKFGNHAFHEKNVEVIKLMLNDHGQRCVLDCGWGSMTKEVQEALRGYCRTNPVINVIRSMRQIRQFLHLSDRHVSLLRRGEAYHRSCSNYEFYNAYDPSCETQGDVVDRQSPNYSFKLKEAKKEFCHFLRLIQKVQGPHLATMAMFSLPTKALEARMFTHVVPLRLSEIVKGLSRLEELESCEDAVEIYVDICPADILDILSKQFALIRKKVGVAIVYNTSFDALSDEIISESSKSVINSRFGLMEHGLRLGAEFLVVDLDHGNQDIHHLLPIKGATKIIGQHKLGADKHGGSSGLSRYQEAVGMGCDLVRIIYQQSPTDGDQNLPKDLKDEVQSSPGPHRPLITYYSGLSKATLSKIENTVLTPVIHHAFATLEHEQPGSLDAQQAMAARHQRNLIEPLRFYLIGSNVPYSLGPAMHGVALKICGLPYTYSSIETTSIEEIRLVSEDPYFGGASITHKMKTHVFRETKFKGYHAIAIGAVNTLIPLRRSANGEISLEEQICQRGEAGPVVGWYGDNTDWIGMTNCLQRNLSPRNVVQPSRTSGLVIGAGGMARAAIYTLLQADIRRLFIYNRTVPNAEVVAHHFRLWLSSQKREHQEVRVLSSCRDKWPEDSDQPTIVISCVPAQSGGGFTGANFEMPAHWLQSPTGGVVLEMAYQPLETPLLRQVRKLRAENGQEWVTVDGLELLSEQGIAQFELLTGRKAPRRAMRLEVRKEYARRRAPEWGGRQEVVG